jgi:hypothetical protein
MEREIVMRAAGTPAAPPLTEGAPHMMCVVGAGKENAAAAAAACDGDQQPRRGIQPCQVRLAVCLCGVQRSAGWLPPPHRRSGPCDRRQ